MSFPYSLSPSFLNIHTNCLLRVTGQINRAKNQQAGVVPAPMPTYDSSSTFSSMPSHLNEHTIDAIRHPPAYGRGGGFYRGRGRGGYRVGKPPTHRHRTLVLNGTLSANTLTNDTASSSVSSPSFVTRNDRHLQLINTNVYQEQTEARTKAIEQTRQQKLLQKEKRERFRFMNHLRQTGNFPAASTDSTSAPAYQIDVDGINFAVVKNGSKLIKLPGAPHTLPVAHCASAHPCAGDPNAPKATPKVTTIGGVKFYRTRNGNMYRQAIIKAQRYVARPGDAPELTRGNHRRSGAVTKVNVPCKTFSTTGILLQQLPRNSPPWHFVMCVFESHANLESASLTTSTFSQVHVKRARCAASPTITPRLPLARNFF